MPLQPLDAVPLMDERNGKRAAQSDQDHEDSQSPIRAASAARGGVIDPVQAWYEAAQDNELLMLQLCQLQEELESYYFTVQTLQNRLEGLEGRLRRMEKSRSWRLTMPLRALAKRFRKIPLSPDR